MSASAAQDRARIEFLRRPNRGRVSGQFGVAFETTKPFPTALESDRDDIALVVVMSAARFFVDIYTDDFDAVNRYLQLGRSRGHNSTNTDAITQHALITINPPSNEPPLRWLSSPTIFGPT